MTQGPARIGEGPRVEAGSQAKRGKKREKIKKKTEKRPNIMPNQLKKY